MQYGLPFIKANNLKVSGRGNLVLYTDLTTAMWYALTSFPLMSMDVSGVDPALHGTAILWNLATTSQTVGSHYLGYGRVIE